MSSIEEKFGETVRYFRNKRGVSQEEFASVAGIHRTYVSSVELGKVKVSIEVAAKLIKALDLRLPVFWKHVEKLLEQDSKGN
ncbi:MAG: helix-turn-helix transcriptional regulator [Planctomycetota bacterium]